MRIIMSQNQQTTAINALYLAADEYDKSAAVIAAARTNHPELYHASLIAQFERQAREARELAELIEQNAEESL